MKPTVGNVLTKPDTCSRNKSKEGGKKALKFSE